MIQISLLILMLILLFMLSRNFTNDPFSYRNILLTGAVIFLVSLMLDETYGLPTRFLSIPLCLLRAFISISNVVLLIREGFRLHNYTHNCNRKGTFDASQPPPLKQRVFQAQQLQHVRKGYTEYYYADRTKNEKGISPNCDKFSKKKKLGTR